MFHSPFFISPTLFSVYKKNTEYAHKVVLFNLLGDFFNSRFFRKSHQRWIFQLINLHIITFWKSA